jgi:hypothetical protein
MTKVILLAYPEAGRGIEFLAASGIEAMVKGSAHGKLLCNKLILTAIAVVLATAALVIAT